MKAETILEVVKKLAGNINPTGDSSIDGDRLENAKLFIQVLDEMHTMVDGIAFEYKSSPYASEQRIGRVCHDWLVRYCNYDAIE